MERTVVRIIHHPAKVMTAPSDLRPPRGAGITISETLERRELRQISGYTDTDNHPHLSLSEACIKVIASCEMVLHNPA